MSVVERKLGRYELLRRLAMGGMGEIYLARARGAGGFEKQVIIKTILPHLAEEEEFVTKFLDEGHIVVQLTHGNIVPVFDMGEQEGTYFIAMEYVPGLDMRAVLKRLSARDELLPVEVALYVACEICKGLGYAHRKVDAQGNSLHIVHRDVSPSNVLISTEGEVKIIDFGIARAAGKLSQTASGAIQGKCCYMSPEQARGQALDARSDIFSTGVLLYEMLTSTRPFEGRSDLESLELVRTCEVDPPGVLRPEISTELDQIITKALALDPDDRYQSIDELYVELQHELYRLGHTVTSQRLVGALASVFEDEAADEPFCGKPANLDQALELELARLGADERTPSHKSAPSPLGFADTATSAKSQTRTISPTPAARPTSKAVAAVVKEQAEEATSENETNDALSVPAPPFSDEPDSVPSSASRRTATAVAVASVVFVALVTGVWFLLPKDQEATLTLDTDPPGALIHLDGEELAGRRTPETLTLAPGNYSIELTLEEHTPRRFRVDLSAGEVVELSARELRLAPVPRPARTFTVHVDADEALLSADGNEIGTTPASVTVNPGEVVNLSATAPGCSPVFYTLTYGHQREEIHLSLSCRVEIEPDEQTLAAESTPRPTQERERWRQVLVESRPIGAEIIVDDEFQGRAPLYVRLREDRQAIIEARREGFIIERAVTRADELPDGRLEFSLQETPQGCLNFRAVYPANNEIAINGRFLEGRHMALRRHSLPAGDNQITVRHPESGKEETFQVHIEPGTDCKVLTVWER